MHRSRIRGIAVAVTITLLVALAASCGSEPEPIAEPELTTEDLLASAGEQLAAITTAKFSMVDETRSGQMFFGTTLKTVEGDIRSPEAARMLVDVEAPGMGFVQLEIVAAGDKAFMKFSRDAPWLPLPPEQVPFNFGGIGTILSDILPLMTNVTNAGKESFDGFDTIRINGDVQSEQMSGLISSVDSGHPINLSFWFDETDHRLRQLRIVGQLFDMDGPGTSRLVNMDINVPVDIQLPDMAAGS
ncbi:MAG: LppX_LprAFG lipoprotein [Acidobacteriota bacterium]|nr:LppX_LprAFG lipoprotein [Acidobacteriota bacterium]